MALSDRELFYLMAREAAPSIQDVAETTVAFLRAHADLTLLPGGGYDSQRFKVGDQVAHRSDPYRTRGQIIDMDDDEYTVQWYPMDTTPEFVRDDDLVPYGFTGPRAAATDISPVIQGLAEHTHRIVPSAAEESMEFILDRLKGYGGGLAREIAELDDKDRKTFLKLLKELAQKTSATVEDTEPPNNFGFLKEPHKNLYSCAFDGNDISEKTAATLKNHVLNAIGEGGYHDADEWIVFTVYGSGLSYNWDEDGDFDIQMWLDAEKYNEIHTDDPKDADDLLADVRRIVQLVNFPSFKELGLSDSECEGRMLIQYYPKPGKGTDEENLASKPYACYNLDERRWIVRPKPITPQYYGDWFIMIEPKAQDIALQASAALESLERNVVDWQFWTQMYGQHRNPKYQEKADDARLQGQMDKAGILNLFENVFQGRAAAYSPEGQGYEDERDLMQKLLEVWGIFQRLKHSARAPLPWEEQELPEEPSESDVEAPESPQDAKPTEGEGKSSSLLKWSVDTTTVAEAMHTILSSGGGTFNLDLTPANYTDGYYSAVHGYEKQIPVDQFTESILKGYVDAASTRPDYLFGAWIENDIVFLDVSKHFDDLQTALEFGIANAQKAIWDIVHNVEIYVNPQVVSRLLTKTAAWGDLMEKAQRLRNEGRVHILNNGADHVVGRVEGDHGTYTTQFWRQDPNSRAITMWDCECPWDQYAWQRTRQWKKYEGRPCSHTLALYWQSQSQPVTDEAQQTIPGTEYTPAPLRPYDQNQPFPQQTPAPPEAYPPGPFVPTTQQPLQPPIPNQPVTPGGMPALAPAAQPRIDPRVLQQMPPTVPPTVTPGATSQPTQPGSEGTVGIPGALSSWRRAMADRTGVPEVDKLIEDFLKTPQGEWTTDELPIEALRDPELAHGMCQAVTEQFVEFAKSRGFNAYVTDTDLNEMGYKPSIEPFGEIGFDKNDEMQYGFYPEHTVASIYLDESKFPIVIDFTATQYGYTDHPKVTKNSWRFASFENGQTVRAEVPLVGIDRDGNQWRIPRNSKGEVLSADEQVVVAIFPLQTGQLEPHLVKVQAEPAAFSGSTGSPFVRRRR